jgi:7,8-dihydroneopterin aldolase/epimerase/oxygenase
MPDRQKINLSDVPVHLNLGVTAAERAGPQEVLVSVEIEIPDPPHFETGNLADTIDYDSIIGFIRSLPDFGPTALIETLAERVAGFCLSLSPRVAAAHVAVKKPSVLAAPALVSITLSRHADAASRRLALHVAKP